MYSVVSGIMAGLSSFYYIKRCVLSDVIALVQQYVDLSRLISDMGKSAPRMDLEGISTPTIRRWESISDDSVKYIVPKTTHKDQGAYHHRPANGTPKHKSGTRQKAL
jgi:hypothetical protein